MNKDEQYRCDKNWKWANAYWQRKHDQFKLHGWTFKMNNSKTTLGMCKYGKKQVCISSYLLRGISCDENKIRNTILHEIAHIIAGHENNHNHNWKKVAVSIGASPATCGTMDTIDPSYIMYCPKGCFKKGYHRKPKIEGKICK